MVLSGFKVIVLMWFITVIMLYSKRVRLLQTAGQTIVELFYSTERAVFDRIGTLVGLYVVICLHVISYTVNKTVSQSYCFEASRCNEEALLCLLALYQSSGFSKLSFIKLFWRAHNWSHYIFISVVWRWTLSHTEPDCWCL